MNVAFEYENFCKRKGITFSRVLTVNPYDESTLFCPAGMQQYKDTFPDETRKGTVANIQSCIRMNDFDEITDTTHMLSFDMVGLFSFREMTVSEAISFWMEFLAVIDLSPDYATIHPDRPEWAVYYKKFGVETKFDQECTWSDGKIGGYCTEFYINGVEVGNIVNPLGTCIDVGFGLERLQRAVNAGTHETYGLPNKSDKIRYTVNKIIESGYKPGPKQQGYVLRKLLRELYNSGGSVTHPYFEAEIKRQDKTRSKYLALKEKHSDKTKEWWWDTHGIDTDEI